jgi:hypothetical protein
MTRVLTEYLVGESLAILSVKYKVENCQLDITELERSTFMGVPGRPGSIFIPEDRQVVTGIIIPGHRKLVAEVALDFIQELLVLDV